MAPANPKKSSAPRSKAKSKRESAHQKPMVLPNNGGASLDDTVRTATFSILWDFSCGIPHIYAPRNRLLYFLVFMGLIEKYGTNRESATPQILEFFKTTEFQDVVSRVNKGAADASAMPAAQRPSSPVAQTAAAAQSSAKRHSFVFKLGPRLGGDELSQWREARRAAVNRFHAKKAYQRENPTVRYTSRKTIADNRPRVKGRFVKTPAVVTA
eukprot:SAG31_NODE_4147_length_3531_cov_1.458333_5_plen_212_part_00